VSDSDDPIQYGSIYEQSFEVALGKLGLGGASFDFFWRHIEAERGRHPFDYAQEIPDSEGIRVFRTRGAFDDLPSLLVYYRVTHDPNMIVYVSVSPDWGDGAASG
jgi:hypothetical protein